MAVPLTVGAGLLVVTVVVAGALTPGYDHSADTVSRLASPGQPHAAVVRAAIVAVGALVTGRAWELRSDSACCPRVVSRLVGTAGVAMVVAGLAPKDPPGGMTSLASRLHVAAVVCGVTALAVAMACTVRHGRRQIERRGSAAALALVVVSGTAFPVAWGTGAYGTLQRVVLTTTLVWLLAVSSAGQATRPGGSGSACTTTSSCTARVRAT